MNAFPLSPMIVEQLGWVLVHSLWQFAIVALLTAVARLDRGGMVCRRRAVLTATVVRLA
jgi:hypothetical protein